MLEAVTRLGEGVVAGVSAGFAAALSESAGAAWRLLERQGRLHDDALAPDLELPWAFAVTLAAAIAIEEREGSPRAETLRRHYLDLMPRQRVVQLATRDEPNATLLHTRLDLARMPRLAAALARLYALVTGAGASPAAALPAASPGELVELYPTLARLYARTFYGGFMPLLHGTPADLARAARGLTGADALTVIDRHLVAPIVHELAHLGRSRRALLPLYLDECIAGQLGVLAHPPFAYPGPDDVDALFCAPWFAQIGQALMRRFGVGPILRAHAGAAPWIDVVGPDFVEAAVRRGWHDYLERRGPHFLSDGFRPEPWLALIFENGDGGRGEGEGDCDADDDEDRIIADALRAMCLETRIDAGAHVVCTRAPEGPVRIDVAGRRVTTAPRGADPAPPAYFLPPDVVRRLEALGITELSINLRDPGEIPRLVAVLRRPDLCRLGPWRASFS